MFAVRVCTLVHSFSLVPIKHPCHWKPYYLCVCVCVCVVFDLPSLFNPWSMCHSVDSMFSLIPLCWIIPRGELICVAWHQCNCLPQQREEVGECECSVMPTLKIIVLTVVNATLVSPISHLGLLMIFNTDKKKNGKAWSNLWCNDYVLPPFQPASTCQCVYADNYRPDYCRW